MTVEAVNSVLSNAPYTRAAVSQQSVAESYAANPDRIQQTNLQAPYISLYIKVDVNFDKAILQLRDSDTGDVVQQIPSESQLEAYRRAQSSNAVRPAEHRELAERIAEPAPERTSEPAPTRTEAKAEPVAEKSTPAPSAPISIDTEA